MAAGADREDAGVLGIPNRVALDPQAQRIDAVGRPVLLGRELKLGLAVEGRIDVVVVQRHGLVTAVDDGPLGERGRQVADDGTGVVGPAVDPGLVDAVAFIIRVAFHVVDDEEVGHAEAPDGPHGDASIRIDFIDAPEIRSGTPREVLGGYVTGL